MGDDIQKIRELIESAERNIREVRRIYQNIAGSGVPAMSIVNVGGDGDSENVVEGRFDGQSMIDDAGKMYPVSANYASKSKLVEGDRLKLTIMDNGSFIFKQIGPIERNRVIATIKEDGTGRGFIAEASAYANASADKEDKTYKILFASVTYFKVKSGDKVVLLVPRDKPSVWGAIENILEVGYAGGISESVNNFTKENIEKDIINPEKETVEDKIGDFEW